MLIFSLFLENDIYKKFVFQIVRLLSRKQVKFKHDANLYRACSSLELIMLLVGHEVQMRNEKNEADIF